MKPIILFLLLVLATTLFIVSCSKEKVFKKEVYGKWEKRSGVGFEFPYKEYAPGNGNYVELTENNIFNIYTDGKIIHSTSYSIQNKKIECSGYIRNSYWSLVYDNMDDEINVLNDTLILSTPPCTQDGGTATYVRIPD